MHSQFTPSRHPVCPRRHPACLTSSSSSDPVFLRPNSLGIFSKHKFIHDLIESPENIWILSVFLRPTTRLLQLHEAAGFGPSTGPTHEEACPGSSLIVVNQRENEVGLFSLLILPSGMTSTEEWSLLFPDSFRCRIPLPTDAVVICHETAFGFEPLCKKLIATLPASQRVTSKNLEIKECLVLPEGRASKPPLVASYRVPTVFCPSPFSRLQRHHQPLGELA